MGAHQRERPRIPRVPGIWVLLFVLALPACGGTAELPSPRPIIVFSGVRVHADAEEMREIDRWLRDALHDIERSGDFRITVVHQDSVGPPWESVQIEGDTATVAVQRTAPDTETPYMVYAHLRLMEGLGRLDEWLPEAADVEGFEREKEILDRVGAVWLFGRAIYDTTPFRHLDELLYAREFGYLEPYLLTARSDEFPEEREEWLAESPEEMEEFRSWFRDTFESDPPGDVAAEDRAGR